MHYTLSQNYLILAKLRPPRGSVKLISTKLTNLVLLEQSHHKPMRMYGGVPLSWQHEGSEAHLFPHSLHTANLRGTPPYIPIGLWWDCSNDTRFVSLVEMSFTDPRGGLKSHPSDYQHKTCVLMQHTDKQKAVPTITSTCLLDSPKAIHEIWSFWMCGHIFGK